MKKNAQAALEYLFTYGWAFLAILLTLGSLAYFGVFNLDNLRGNACEFPPGFLCDDYALSDEIDSDPYAYIFVLNAHGVDLNVTSMNATNFITDEIECEANESAIPSSGYAWLNEEYVEFRCEIDSAEYVDGQSYEFTFDMQFQQIGNSYTYNTSGTALLTAQ